MLLILFLSSLRIDMVSELPMAQSRKNTIKSIITCVTISAILAFLCTVMVSWLLAWVTKLGPAHHLSIMEASAKMNTWSTSIWIFTLVFITCLVFLLLRVLVYRLLEKKRIETDAMKGGR
jgi:hypothetical protein